MIKSTVWHGFNKKTEEYCGKSQQFCPKMCSVMLFALNITFHVSETWSLFKVLQKVFSAGGFGCFRLCWLQRKHVSSCRKKGCISSWNRRSLNIWWAAACFCQFLGCPRPERLCSRCSQGKINTDGWKRRKVFKQTRLI